MSSKKQLSKTFAGRIAASPSLKSEDAKSDLFINSIEKGMRVLKAFDGSQRQLSLTQISAMTGLDISSTQRCIYTLKTLGYLRKDPITRNYELTLRVVDFAFQYLSSSNLVNRAGPYLQQLGKETEEATNLTVLDGTEIVFLARLVSRYVLARSVIVGTRLPAYCTSSGLAMLAHIPEAQVEEILMQSNLVKYTPHTVVDPQAIRERLQAIRGKGYAHTKEEYYLGDISTAAPVRNASGYAIGAVNIAVAKSRWGGGEDEKRIADLVISAASAISEQGKRSGQGPSI
jgi:Transcriptional regulator